MKTVKRAGLFLPEAICEQSGKETTTGVIANTAGQQTNDLRANLASRGQMLFRVTKRLLCPMLVLFCVAFCARNAQGQCTSSASGNWNVGANWSCGHQPTSADGVITVASGHTMTVTAAVTVDEVVVAAGGQITVNSGITLTLANGTGIDLDINGTVLLNGTIGMGTSVSMTVESGGTLNVPAGGLVSMSGGSAATRAVLTELSGGTMTVGGNITGGLAQVILNGTVTVSGQIGLSNNSPLSVASTGNVTVSSVAGIALGGGTSSPFSVNGTLSLTGSATITLTGGSAPSNPMTINSGGILKLPPSTVISSSTGGPFTLASGANIEIGSTAGITTSGATGNIQVAGTRTYSAGANYTYNGTAAQVTGNGLPATVNDLTIANTGGNVTLTASTTVSVILTLTSGDLVTGANTLSQAVGSTSAGTTDVVGNANRTHTFTAGTSYAFGNPNVTVNFASGTPPTAININLAKSVPSGFTSAIARTYDITPTGGGVFSATLRLHYLISELNGNTESRLVLWKEIGGVGGTWTLQGATGQSTAPPDNWVEFAPVSAFSRWTLANGPTDVAMVGYGASHGREGKVLIQWETGREVNNLGFNVYRQDGDKRVRVNRSLIVGSGLTARPGTVMSAGRSYAWMTSVAQAKESVFWIEEIDFSGRTVWHGPISSQESGGMLTMSAKQQAILEQTSTVSDLATESTNAGVTRPVETLATSGQAHAMKITGAAVTPKPPINLLNPTVKISLKQEGWYRVTQPQLVAAGLNPAVDPNALQLFAYGQEVPISVITNNGAFDSTSAIEFYGLPINTPSTDTHVYSLVAGGSGKRIAIVQGNSGLPPANSFLYTVERRDRAIYLSGILNGEAENFFGSIVGSPPTDQAITLQHVDATAAGQTTIEVGMQGLSLTPHIVTVSLNGSPIGTISYDSQTQGVAQFSLPNSSLAEGQNLVTLSGQQGVLDVSLVDHIRVSYWHTYAADGNALKFTASANQQVTLAGFTSADVKVFDVTDPNVPAKVAATVTSQKSSPAFVVTVAVPGTGTRTLLAIGDDQTRSPLAVVADKATTWKSKSNAADLVIITHDSLKDSFKQLQALRQSQGLKVTMVDVEDLYDEFSFSNKSPQAIKDFLAYAKTNWKTAPKYVLLAGSASYDPKNYNGLGEYDLVPTKLIDTSFSETASDDWFADFNLDGIAEMAVGRLPVPTSEEAQTTITKLAVYENSPGLNSALLVADGNDGFDFEAANASLAGLFPGSMTVQQIDRGQIGTAAAKQQLLDGIASGQKIVNYVGHGSPSIWRDNLLTSADALALTNTGRYPLFIAMTCLNGEFQHPELHTLAAALMNSREGGAVAVWASSGFTVPSGQAVMNRQFYTLLFQSNRPVKGMAAQAGMTLGEITTNAKSSVGDADIRRTWILFGDPSMRVK